MPLMAELRYLHGQGYKYFAPTELKRCSNDGFEKVLALLRKVCFGAHLVWQRQLPFAFKREPIHGLRPDDERGFARLCFVCGVLL